MPDDSDLDGINSEAFSAQNNDMPEQLPSVRLDKIQLLEAMRYLREFKKLESMREYLGLLKKRIDDSGSQLHAHDDVDAVNFPYRLLLQDLNQIAASQTLERAHYYVDRFVKAITEERVSPINDIKLNRWKEYNDIYTDSFWHIKRRDSSGAHTADYWGNFIPQIPYQMMQRYTKRGEWVLDVFAGSGTTLIEAQRRGRNCLGIELQPNVADRAQRLIDAEPNQYGVTCKIITDDSTSADYKELLQKNGAESVQLVIMHPPYFDIIKFSNDARDLSNAGSVESFIERMGQVVERAAAVLDRGRYLVLVIGDKYVKGEWIPLGFQTMSEIQQRGFLLKSIVVKNFEETAGKRSQKELWKYRALVGGFYVFKHEYIFIFKKL